jgi:proteasome lid subunit RPN8/RPN11
LVNSAVAKPRIDLPAALAAAIRHEARRAAPRECCGLLEGVRAADSFTIQALHPARNLSDDPDRFEIDPRDHIAAVRTARERGGMIVGCYHSHPRGPAKPSASDRAGAGEEDFLWLIAAGERLEAFLYLGGEFLGADWVTSSQ